MKLSEMKQILAAENIRLTKSLGQNFLHDGNQLRRVVDAADLNSSDRVLEVGPGLGPLTELLLAKAAEVIGIEKDQRLAAPLQRRLSGVAHFQLIVADALVYLRAHPIVWPQWKMVSNLPYSIASPLLVDLALSQNPPRRMVATLQWEVAQRLVATPGTDSYGLLSLLVQLRYQPLGSFRISRSCFFPEPDIDSSTVILAVRPYPLLKPEEVDTFVTLVKLAFSQRRKMMFKLLKTRWTVAELTAGFEMSELATTVRAEEVSLEQFVTLTRPLVHGKDERGGPALALP